ncbi:phage protease [Laribacter hongkongensis]|uniref:phage protease n=1 Tax=Laribacter hongkongensis TaxID=168471 RepID=UPI001EFCB83D|nr:phage protease [Laribacter hongkongensis]MCG9040427.1 phage protease [Laribacter hongkongensis]MCG9067081.1 phage protease [Laribacter hongkongensis]
MALRELIALLGLPETAQETDILDAVKALRDRTDSEPDPARFVPIAVVKELQRKLAEALQQQSGQEMEQVIAAAMSDGRLLPFQEAWARKLGESDLAQLREYVDQAAPIAALRGTQTGGKPPVGSSGTRGRQLTSAELQAAKALGRTPEQYLALLGTSGDE